MNAESAPLKQWLIGALLHDIGKVQINEAGRWSRHELLREALLPLVGDELAAIIATHHKGSPRSGPFRRRSLILADRLQKSIAMAIPFEADDRYIETLKALWPPIGAPLYGEPVVWTADRAAELTQRLVNELSGDEPPGVEAALGVQHIMASYPHTNYLPHLCLGTHNRLTGALFCLVWRFLRNHPRAESPVIFLGGFERNFSFSLVTIEPSPAAVWDETWDTEDLTRLRECVFTNTVQQLPPGLSPAMSVEANPFDFSVGRSLIWLWDRPDDVIEAAERFSNSTAAADLQITVQTLSSVSAERTVPETTSSVRRETIEGSSADQQPDVPRAFNEQAKPLQTLIITVPQDLTQAAQTAASGRIATWKEIWYGREDCPDGLAEVPIEPSPCGMLEYVQALDDFRRLHRGLRGVTEAVSTENIRFLAISPAVVAVSGPVGVMKETMIPAVRQRLRQLHLPARLHTIESSNHVPGAQIERVLGADGGDSRWRYDDEKLVRDGEISGVEQ
ncbi:MAG: HD domain-containing protein [Armatimonadota bacterium]